MFYRQVFSDSQDIEIKEDAEAPLIPQKLVLTEFFKDSVKTGEIRIENGADGTYILFDCDCIDALPYCRAQCCALKGTYVFDEELTAKNLPVEVDLSSGQFTMKRDADGFCSCLSRTTRRCEIYDDRPRTCQDFHCTRGADVRGWKLANHVHRQSMI